MAFFPPLFGSLSFVGRVEGLLGGSNSLSFLTTSYGFNGPRLNEIDKNDFNSSERVGGECEGPTRTRLCSWWTDSASHWGPLWDQTVMARRSQTRYMRERERERPRFVVIRGLIASTSYFSLVGHFPSLSCLLLVFMENFFCSPFFLLTVSGGLMGGTQGPGQMEG